MIFYHDKQHDVLIYPAQFTPNPTYLPEARPINGSWFGVKRTLRNCQILRHLNFPVPPFITDLNYDWPIKPGYKPLETQRLMANFSVLHPRMFNLSDPGTMKTLSSLWAADFLMRMYPPGACRCLIVGTLSTLETTWAKEIFSNFLDSRSFEILHGTAEKRLALLEKPRDFYICNHDGVGVGAHTRKKFELDGFSKALAEREDIKIVIVDEASAYKDAQTKRHRIARLAIAKRPYLWPLTGSPTPTAPTDAYGIAKLVNNAFGKSFSTFQSETMFKVTQFRWVPQRDGYDKAAKILSPAIRIPIDAVWDGPKLTTEQRLVALTPQQTKLMKDLKNDLQVPLKAGQPISAVNEASARQKFLQISLGAVYDENHKVHLADAEPRYSEAERVIEETTRKIVIFAGLTSVVELLYKRLHKQFEAEIINGNVPQKERAKIIRSFAESGGLRIVICDPQATAHGINEFVAADTAIWFGTTEKAELYDQGNKRIRRPGQKYPTRAVQIVSNPLEKEIFRRLENNLGLQGSLLSLIQGGQI
ncbi:MAG: DEAD/DEAH box helicase [Hyphomicrobium sp.]|jgi:SNF2 family DNA or RNA helicase